MKTRRPSSRSGTRNPRINAWLQRNAQAFFASLGHLWRHPLGSSMTILVIGIALALPLNFHLLVQNIQKLAGHWENSAGISLYINAEIRPDDLKHFIEELQRMPEFKTIRHITPQQALEEFRQASGLSAGLDLLDINPLPHVLILTPADPDLSAETARNLLQQFDQHPLVETAKADLQWLQRLQAIAQMISRGVWVLSLLLALAVVLVIGNTIRLEIHSRSSEIQVIKLVGGTNAFIRRPFLYEGLWYGLIGGFIACLLVLLSTMLLSTPIETLKKLYDSRFSLQGLSLTDVLTVLGGSALLGVLGAWMAVSRHLGDIDPA